MYRHSFFALLTLCLPAIPAVAQVTSVTAPAAVVNVKSSDDFATVKFQDPWDMKQNTDLGWHIWSIDAPPTGIAPGFAFNQPPTASAPNGSSYFHAVTSNTSPNLELLQNGNPFSAKLGRTGDMFPIDASVYTMLSFRMCVSGTGTPPRGGFGGSFTSSTGYVVYSTDAGALGAAGPFIVYSGCQIYTLDLTTLAKQDIGSGQVPWSGTIRQIRLDPTHVAGVTIDLDWVRLVAPVTGTTAQTISWSGGGSADIYLDNDQLKGNGTLGMLYRGNGGNALSSLAKGVSTGFTFDVAALSPGQYFVMVCPTSSSDTEGASNCVYAPGSFKVNAAPTITVTSPDPTGSADDFATVQLNNAWDFNALTDIDYYQNIPSLSIDTAFPAQRPDGTDLGNIRVLKGTSVASPAAGWGDPYFYTLYYAGNGRGVTKKIDANRYRVLTIDMGLAGARDINGGSIARVVWKTTTETAENVSQDILINHRAGVNILDRISVDMKALLLETGPGNGTSGWNGQVENFRFDPHEFTPNTSWWVNQIKLAAFETIDSSATYTIRWSAADEYDSGNATGATVSASYQPANAAGTAPSGTITPIGGVCAAVAAASGSCTWSTGNVPNGTYYVLLTVTDGVNSNTAYSAYPVIVDHSATAKPRMFLDRNILNFGGHNENGQSITLTPGQQVRLTFTGTGASTTAWTAATAGSQSNLFAVSPASGTGPATLTVSVPANTTIPNNLIGPLGTVVVNAAAADNTPQSIIVNLAMTSTTTAPFGGFDTPAANAVLQGSIAVTGWVLDDIGVSAVNIWRDPHPSDPPGAVQGGRVFIGTATIVDGARPDIVALFPNAPANYNAGWGYLMLTRGLIWDGAGSFNLYAVATDVDGHTVTLGSKTVSIDNASATKPFGTIDTPGQGGTASGVNYPNTGWVLTPNGGATIPASGVQVAIDGVFLPIVFGISAKDFGGAFPFDTTQAGRGAFIDMTQFADGIHTIGWFVTDSLGKADGVGSRFFRVQNGSGLLAAPGQIAADNQLATFLDLGRRPGDLRAPRAGTVAFGVGTARTAGMRAVGVAGAPAIRIAEMQRVLVQAGSAQRGVSYAAYRVDQGRLGLLPAGAKFDANRGTLTWQPVPGFLGDYDFLFVKSRNGRAVSQTPVRIIVGTSTATLRAGLFKAAAATEAETPETR